MTKNCHGSMIRHLACFLDPFKAREGIRRQAGKNFCNKCSENSKSQIVFRTGIFRKLTLGAPGKLGECEQFTFIRIA